MRYWRIFISIKAKKSQRNNNVLPLPRRSAVLSHGIIYGMLSSFSIFFSFRITDEMNRMRSHCRNQWATVDNFSISWEGRPVYFAILSGGKPSSNIFSAVSFAFFSIPSTLPTSIPSTRPFLRPRLSAVLSHGSPSRPAAATKEG